MRGCIARDIFEIVTRVDIGEAGVFVAAQTQRRSTNGGFVVHNTVPDDVGNVFAEVQLEPKHLAHPTFIRRTHRIAPVFVVVNADVGRIGIVQTVFDGFFGHVVADDPRSE